MSYVHEDTLVVCFLSSDPTLRLYESDLLREFDQKELGLAEGHRRRGHVFRPGSRRDVVIECKGLRQIGDENLPVIDVIVGQLLAFFRCMEEGLRPIRLRKTT